MTELQLLVCYDAILEWEKAQIRWINRVIQGAPAHVLEEAKMKADEMWRRNKETFAMYADK